MGRRRVYRDHSREDMALAMQMMTMLSQMYGTPFQRQEAERAREFDWAHLMQTQKGSMEMAKAAHSMGMTQLAQQFSNQKELDLARIEAENKSQKDLYQFQFGIKKEADSIENAQHLAKIAMDEAKAAVETENSGVMDPVMFAEAFHAKLGGLRVANQMFMYVLDKMSGNRQAKIAASALQEGGTQGASPTGGTSGIPTSQPAGGLTNKDLAQMGMAAQRHYEQQVQILSQNHDLGVGLGRKAYDAFKRTLYSPEQLAAFQAEALKDGTLPSSANLAIVNAINSVFPPGDNALNNTRNRLLQSMTDPEHYKWFRSEDGKPTLISTGDPDTDAMVATQLRGVLLGFGSALREDAPKATPKEKRSLLGGPLFGKTQYETPPDLAAPLQRQLNAMEERLLTNYPKSGALEESRGALRAITERYNKVNPVTGQPVDLRAISDDSYMLMMARPGADESIAKAMQEIAAARGEEFDYERFLDHQRGIRMLVEQDERLNARYQAARQQNANAEERLAQDEATKRAYEIAQNATAAARLEQYTTAYGDIISAQGLPGQPPEYIAALKVRADALLPKIERLQKVLPDNTDAMTWSRQLGDVTMAASRDYTKRMSDYQQDSSLQQPMKPENIPSPLTDPFMRPRTGPPENQPTPGQPSTQIPPSSTGAAWQPGILPSSMKTIIEYKPQQGPPAPSEAPASPEIGQ